MEQQNQQPFQRKQSTLPSAKNFLTNPKLPLIAAIIVVILTVGGIFLLSGLSGMIPLTPYSISTFEECAKAGYPILESYPRQCQTPDGMTFMESIQDTCIVTGCGRHICSDQEVITTCEFLPEYECYKSAVCERQANGGCGWTQTEKLSQCIQDKKSKRSSIDISTWQTPLETSSLTGQTNFSFIFSNSSDLSNLHYQILSTFRFGE